MNQFEIPKEIRSKSKIFGLEMKEWVVVILMTILLLTFFRDIVHNIFAIPYYAVSVFTLIYLFAPSSHNPDRRNYHSIYFLFKRNKYSYYSIEKNRENKLLYDATQKNNQLASKGTENDNGRTEEKMTFSEVKKKRELKKKNELKEEKKRTDEKGDDISKQLNNLISVSKEKESQEERLDSVLGDESEEQVKKNNIGLDDIKNLVFSILCWLILLINLPMISEYFHNKDTARGKDTEEYLIKALKNASMQDYETAVTYFDKLKYEDLQDDSDKDIMLLSYLFAGKAERSLELEPHFDETVVNYYKTINDMNKLKELSAEVNSDVIDFEVAVIDKDYEKIISLKDNVKLKDDRKSQIIKAYIELKKFDDAILFIKENGLSESYIEDVKVEKKKEKKKKGSDQKSEESEEAEKML